MRKDYKMLTHGHRTWSKWSFVVLRLNRKDQLQFLIEFLTLTSKLGKVADRLKSLRKQFFFHSKV